MNYKLRDLSSQQAQVLEPGDCRVGREAIMDLVLPEGSISRHHANLHNSPEGVVWVIDLGSTNGTSVEGQAAKDWVQVHPGQVIAFGDVSIRLETETATPSAHQSPEEPEAHPLIEPEPGDQPKAVPAELGPSPTASGKLPRETEPGGNTAVSPKNLLAVKPKKASGIVLPPRSATSSQISPPEGLQQKLVSPRGELPNGDISDAGETLMLPTKEQLQAHRQVESLVKRANAIAQSTPPERNTGEILEAINQKEEAKSADKNRQTDSFKLPPLEASPQDKDEPVGRSPEHDTSMERLRMKAEPVLAPVVTPAAPAAPVSPPKGTAAPGAFVYPEPRQSSRLPDLSKPSPAVAAAVPKAQVQPADPVEELIRQPLPPMARMPAQAPSPVPAPVPPVTATSVAPAPQAPLVKASEVAFYKCLAFLGVGLLAGFLAGVLVSKYLL